MHDFRIFRQRRKKSTHTNLKIKKKNYHLIKTYKAEAFLKNIPPEHQQVSRELRDPSTHCQVSFWPAGAARSEGELAQGTKRLQRSLWEKRERRQGETEYSWHIVNKPLTDNCGFM